MVMSDKHFIADIQQKAIMEYDGKILLIRAEGKSIWEIPGGRLHDSEDPREGIKREIKEELSLDIEPQQIIDVFAIVSDSGRKHFMVAWSCKLLSDPVGLKRQKEEIDEARWFSRDEIQDLAFYKEHGMVLKRYFAERVQ